MKPKLFLVCLAALIAVAVGSVRASDPVGIYCLINKVVFEPNDTEPTSVQLWGAFSAAVRRQPSGALVKPAGAFGDNGDVYGSVQVGYLYYKCAVGTDARCTNEWADLKSLAAKGTVAGFGGRYAVNGRVRPASEAPSSPDAYPLNIGVIPIGQSRSIFTGVGQLQYPDLVSALKAALVKK